MRKAFLKFGRLLVDPSSGISLTVLGSMKVKHDYKQPLWGTGSKHETPALDRVLKSKRFNTMTERLADMKCTLCGTSNQVEVHHLRAVKDIRAKIRTGDSTYAEWKGGFLRKQVPLCSYHHRLLHRGQLNSLDMRTLKS